MNFMVRLVTDLIGHTGNCLSFYHLRLPQNTHNPGLQTSDLGFPGKSITFC